MSDSAEDKVKCVIYDCCHSLAQPSMRGQTWGEIKDFLTRHILNALPQWQPIETAPENTDILVRWPMRLVDENDMPTGEITSCHTIIAQKNKELGWDDQGSMCDASASWMMTDDETAFEPTYWMPLPQPPE